MSAKFHGQAGDSVARNHDFFAGDTYARNADRLDSHDAIRSVLTSELEGSGGCSTSGTAASSRYEPSVVDSITAVDLFFDPENGARRRPNIAFRSR